MSVSELKGGMSTRKGGASYNRKHDDILKECGCVFGYSCVCRTAYKLLIKRADGTLGPLLINRRQRIPIGEWLEAEDHPTKGYKHRPGWHTLREQCAPHLTERGRVWCKVAIQDVVEFERPAAQGGVWFLAQHMKVLEVL